MTHETNARIGHHSGYNCAQAVMVAFSDELGVTPIAAIIDVCAFRGELGASDSAAD